MISSRVGETQGWKDVKELGIKNVIRRKKMFIHSKTIVMKGFGAKRKKFVSIQSLMAEP